jgi:hypothetical protein
MGGWCCWCEQDFTGYAYAEVAGDMVFCCSECYEAYLNDGEGDD